MDDNNVNLDKDTHYINQDDIYEAEILDDNFDEVLQLTNVNIDDENYDLQNSFSGSITPSVEFNAIDVVNISDKQNKLAETFIKNVSSFIKNHDDINLTTQHRKYIDTVANLKISNFADYLIMRDMNKELIYNILNQINASGGEDFVLIQNYNTLVKTQMDLIKASNNLMNSLPNEIKALRNDILSNKELMDADKDDLSDVVTTSENVHNNSRSLLKQIEEQKRLKNKQNNENKQ